MKGKTVLSALLAAIMILTIAASAVAATDDGGDATAFATTTCDSCSDCTKKLNGDYGTVVLTTDLINVTGSGITFGADNVVFDGGGHIIDGDDEGDLESGIMMTIKSGNTIKNCVITDFESGITLYGSSKNEIYDNEISSNYYDGVWISENSDSNNIHDNVIEDNGKYGVFFSSNSNGNTFSENTVCSNPTDIHNSAKNSGDDNVCDTTDDWNDAGTTGCTRDCASRKPDLVITDISNDDGTICYEIKNIGDATASEGHYTTLFVDGLYQIKEQVDVDLPPGASVKRCFDYYTWNCTSPGDTVEVCVDYGDFVDESDEENNCLNVIWRCTSPAPPGDVIIYHADYGAGIWRIDPDGSENTQLSDHGWFAEYSPDNAKIAFGEYYQNGIWVMNADGTGQVQLTSSGNAPTWSPDGTKIAYHVGGTSGTERRIWVMDADGSNAQKLSDSPGDFPAWSPDGTKIAYNGEVGNGIWVINPDGTGDTQLCVDGALPAWSPDGGKMAYKSVTDGCIWTMDADGSDKTKISANAGKHPAWSPDGTKIAYEGDTGIWVINADGTDEHLINQGGHAPDWTSPGIVEELPDLVVTDLWAVDGGVCYQIRNIGEATAPKGHYAFLLIDGIEAAGDLIGVELGPGERLKRCFNYAWQCSPPDDAITVCADHKDVVDEVDEGNNCRKEVWKCDNTQPVIISSPVVSEINQNSVTIAWATNEAGDSLVRFGRTAGKYEDQKSGMKMKQEHKIILTDLLPSTTYHYLVESTDASENTVVSRDGIFETGSVPDNEPPVVHALNITRGKGDFLYYELSADVSDNIGVERVEFYMDGTLIGTDYSEPYQYCMAPASVGMTRAEFFKEHTVEAVAFDRFHSEGILPELFDPLYECADISMDFVFPFPDDTLYTDGDVVPDGTTVPINVYAAVYELSCNPVPSGGPPSAPDFLCSEEISAVSRVEFYVNGVLIDTDYPSSNDEYFNHVYTCDWDASGFPLGTHVIRVDAIASEGCKQTIICDVSVVRGEPSLDVKREVTRTGNCFQVALTVRNRGTASTQLDRIEDNVDGFQPIRKRDNIYEVTAETSNSGRGYDIKIDLFTETGGDTITLFPDGRFTVEYMAIPVVYPDTDPVDYAIGAEDVNIYYSDGSTESFDEPCVLTTGDEVLSSSVEGAIEWSNYLIVTNPARLFAQYNDNDVNELLSAMAELGQLKHGIPGYVQARRASDVRNQINSWGGRMERNGYLSFGYLLLVGETEIIGSWEIKIKNRPRVHYTDLPYANTAGEWETPELIVGRIIGNDASELIIPIQTSINVYKGEPGFEWDRSYALAVSGSGDGANRFENNVDDVADILDDEFSVTKLKQRDVEDAGGNITAEFKAHDANVDVIYFRDHGWPTAWSGVINRTHFGGADPVDFENSKPFAFACCCWAGRYEDEDIDNDGDYEGENGIAETFLQHGTAVYIGATQKSYRGRNNVASEKFFEEWVGSSHSVGRAFRNFKRDFNDRRGRRYWSYEYNLYGDPKYGSVSTVAGAALMPKAAASEPQRSLEIVIPDYNVTTTEGNEHYVEIPRGDTILELDKPMVPFYTTNLDYPVGCRVQDVTLTDRSGMTTETGLNIPDETMEWDSATIGALPSSDAEEWWPEEVFDWTVRENPDSTSTLSIVMYPFYYNPLTTDVEFYKNYKFEINYTSSTVEIAALTTDADVYQQGDDVLVDLWLNNSGDAQDVLVDAVVKAGSSDEVASGLLLRTLKEFEGIASFSPQWDSDGFEPGYYFVKVTLKDTGGDVLDRKTEMFRLGISAGEIASFTATPECFDIGDEIGIAMAFENNGTVNITGTAVIRALNSTGGTAYEFRHNVTNLTPSESISFSDVWDTSEAVAGSSYRIIGYVLYDSKSTDPATVTVQNMIMGDLNGDGEVTTADAGIALELATSGEYDPAADVDCDGQVTSLDALTILQAAAGNIELEGGES